MTSVLAATDEKNNPLHNPFVAQIRQLKQIEPLVLTEINNTMEASTTNASLKRKRPPQIQIPSVLGEISADEVRSRDAAASVGVSGSGFGVFSVKGKKKIMEDSYKIVSNLDGNPKKKGFFGVYDGHGGRKAVDFVAENLHTNILGLLEKCENNLGTEEAVKEGYLKTDQEFLKQGFSSGTCCVTCLIQEKDIVVSNLGDCRAVLSRGGLAEAITRDHSAGQEDERKRIEAKGGYVEIHRGGWRVHGILSVSRSIGDLHLKDWVLADPDTKILNLTPDMEFIVLASDGLWGKVNNQEAVDIAMRLCSIPNKLRATCGLWEEDGDQYGCENTSPPSKVRRISLAKQLKKTQSPIQDRTVYKKKPTSGGPVSACKELVNLAITRGSLDDITVMIIDLRYFQSNN